MDNNHTLEVLRRHLGITKKEFASKLGITQNAYTNYIAGKRNIPTTLILKIKQMFDINANWLLTGKGEMFLKDNIPTKAKNTTNDMIEVGVLSLKPTAGKGANLEAIDLFDNEKKLYIDKLLFKKPPKGKVWAMQMDGYSMIPMLFPDSWVFVDETKNFTGDGLYVINFDNILMVKLLEIDLKTGSLWVKSVNKDYDSWRIDLEDQRHFEILGKVIRCLI